MASIGGNITGRLTAPVAAPHPLAAAQTPNSPVNPYVASQMPTGNFVPGFSSDTGNTDYSGFINATVGAPPGSSTPNAPVYGAGGGPSPGGGAFPQAPQAPQSHLNPFDSDPGYASAHAAEQLGIPTINGSLQDQIARRLTQWGDASFANQAGFGVDPQAAAFARQNYLTGNSELARLDHAHQLQRQAIINRLAGHGLLFSGDTGYQTGQEDQSYGNQVYDGQQRVLGDLYGFQTGALGQKQQLHAATVSALENAFTNAANHPGLYGDGTQSNAGDGSLVAPPQAAKHPAATKAAPHPTKAAIVNTYTTGRKRFG